MAIRQRVLTAVVLIPLFLLATRFLEPLIFAVLIAGVTAIAAWEWAALSGLQKIYHRVVYVLSVLAVLSVVYNLQSGHYARMILYAAILWWGTGVLLVIVYETQAIEIKLVKPWRLVIGYLVLVPAWWSMIVLRGAGDDGVTLVLFLLIMIWLTDSAAYFSGKRWGKRRLAKRVSPGKSLEGMIISLLVVLLLASVSKSWVIGNSESMLVFMFLCVVTAGCSVLGDLVESLVKRTAELKDSGTLLPGHGGVMDRIDSLTAAAPVFLMGLTLMGKVA